MRPQRASASVKPPKPPKPLDPTLDVVFKLLFAAPEAHECLCSLLNAVLRPPSPITRAEVLNPHLPKRKISDRGVVLDIHVHLADGRQVDIEMQASSRPGTCDRALYYGSRMIAGQLRPSQQFEDLRPVVVIFFLAHRILDAKRLVSTFRMREMHDGTELSQALEVHLVELSKGRHFRQEEASVELQQWVQFLKPRNRREREAAVKANTAVNTANKRLKELEANPKVQQIVAMREKALVGLALDRAAERRLGRAEGEAKGKAEAVVSVLAARQIDVPARLRAAILGCRDLAQLDAWLALTATCESAEAFEAR
jgi:predicted transposase/invertase (TIGR01784 family)